MPKKSILEKITQAAKTINPFIIQTPLRHSTYFSNLTGCEVYFKLENLQYTGSFKLRGAINKLCQLSDEQKQRGIVTASTGNHGAAVAYGMQALGIDGEIFVPEGCTATKLSAINHILCNDSVSLGALRSSHIRFHGNDCCDTETSAREYAQKHDKVFISPYNDDDIIAGQGTIADECLQQCPDMSAIFASVGGGGLISGIGSFIKATDPNIKVIGCTPENSAAMMASVAAGKIIDVEHKPTLSDGTAGGIEPDAVTFDICREVVDDFVAVSENEIKYALKAFIDNEHMLCEGAAAVSIASLIKHQAVFKNQKVVIVICGANISLETLKTL